jgi:hypothetical protein
VIFVIWAGSSKNYAIGIIGAVICVAMVGSTERGIWKTALLYIQIRW